MCHFITAVMSPATRADEARRIAKEHLLRWEPIRNKSITTLMQPSDGYFLTTHGMCDCGTAIGSSQRGVDAPWEEIEKRFRKKLRKRHLSHGQIERAVQQEHERIQRRQAEMAQQRLNPGGEIRRWLDFLKALATHKTANSIAVLLHWYDGNIESECINIRSQETVRLSDLSSEGLLTLNEDVFFGIKLGKFQHL